MSALEFVPNNLLSGRRELGLRHFSLGVIAVLTSSISDGAIAQVDETSNGALPPSVRAGLVISCYDLVGYYCRHFINRRWNWIDRIDRWKSAIFRSTVFIIDHGRI